MTIFTQLSESQLEIIARQYGFTENIAVTVLKGGTQNSNYLLTHQTKRYVLSIIEYGDVRQLNDTANYINFLADNAILVNNVITPPSQQKIILIDQKPALLTEFIEGQHISQFEKTHCEQVATQLANIHQLPYKMMRPNKRGWQWICHESKRLLPLLSKDEKKLLSDELTIQAGLDLQALPSGIIHSDLFKDNILFSQDKLMGFIDFYDICEDWYLLDLAIAVNDCCLNKNNQLDQSLVASFLSSYDDIRTLSTLERQMWHYLQKRAALVFWLLRLSKHYFPLTGDNVLEKDPKQYETLLRSL